MSARGISLQGGWTGVYDYGDDAPGEPVAFTASLFDIAGAVWGTTQEPNTATPGADLLAAVSGARSGREVRFRKIYEGAPRGHEAPVDYAGHVTGDGNRIEGRWQIAHGGQIIAGSFVMNRKPGATRREARSGTATEEVLA